MKKKGFTLVELIGSIIILGLLVVIAFPPILNMIHNSQSQIDDSKQQLLFAASEEFIYKYQNEYVNTPGNVYCISYSQLQQENLDTNLKDIDVNTIVKVSITDNQKYEYEVVNECSETIQENN